MLVPLFLARPEGFGWIAADRALAQNWLVAARLIGGVGVGIT